MKRKTKHFWLSSLLCLTAVFVAFAFGACEEEKPTTYTVTFESEFGVAPPSQTVWNYADRLFVYYEYNNGYRGYFVLQWKDGALQASDVWLITSATPEQAEYPFDFDVTFTKQA